MQTRTFAVGLLVSCACAGRPPEPQADPLNAGWAGFGRSELAEVRIERRLYEQAGNPHFLIRVRVTNHADSALGVDLRDGWKIFYPNQWGGLPQPQRFVIDEEIAAPQTLTPELEARLKADYRRNAIVMVPVGESAEYFREFNASGRGDIDATRTPYLFMSIKGQLFVTDGERVESLLPAADCLYLRTPVSWGTVPAAARVVPD